MNVNFTDRFKDELSYLWRFAIRLSVNREIAEELVQKTILRALEKRHQFSEGTKLRSWLFTILHSIWKNELRTQAIRQKVSFSSVDLDDVSARNTSSDNNVFFKQVMKQVNNLPEAQRSVMMLVCIEGYSYQETGDILDIPVGTVMSRLARARLKIGSAFIDSENSQSLSSFNAEEAIGVSSDDL